ncbi:phosphatase PAP2 family protein [Limosilactobacillus sp. WF-MT5-A]|uniref:phosphatase PAP2 family protein n=1 Tax=Limosilactobacillus agrestis TaxID=2759748 RepID=UPI0015F856C7|nr:phosphatase PAP2 family protein [Limosilactobacillus agrestis]MBB1100015.1 phosphatase PAP2 family protein [Limosilactobacillus agrestis]MCD7127144.1 phosphatase PAP2 family protein [Limosilactobacillus agrestis]
MHKKAQIGVGLFCWILFGVLLFNVLTKSSLVRLIDTVGFTLTTPISEFKTTLLTELTFMGDPVTVGILTIGVMLLLWHQGRATDSVWYGMLQFIGYCLVILIKYSVTRLRPSLRLIDVSGYSFPSGHTFSTVIFTFTILAILLPYCKVKWQKILLKIVGALWIIIIMYSRVYLRAHFTSDVVGALLLANGWWLLANSQRTIFFHWLQKPVNKV